MGGLVHAPPDTPGPGFVWPTDDLEARGPPEDENASSKVVNHIPVRRSHAPGQLRPRRQVAEAAP